MKHLFNQSQNTETWLHLREPEGPINPVEAANAATQTPLSAAEIQDAATELGDRVTLTPGQLPNTPAIQAEARTLSGHNEILAQILVAAIRGGLESFGNSSSDRQSLAPQGDNSRPNFSAGSIDIGPVRPGVMGLLDSIARPESGGDYNIMVHGQTWPGGLTNAPVGELSQTQPAKGRYQIVGPTMRGLIDYMGLSGNERFTPDLQDQMAVALLRRDCGLEAFQAGNMTADAFRDRISRVWAGVAGANGRGHYDGDRYGNQASYSIPDNVLASVRSDTSHNFA